MLSHGRIIGITVGLFSGDATRFYLLPIDDASRHVKSAQPTSPHSTTCMCYDQMLIKYERKIIKQLA
jgi:hypothetical protein